MHLLALLLKNNEKSGLMPQLSMGKQVLATCSSDIENY